MPASRKPAIIARSSLAPTGSTPIVGLVEEHDWWVVEDAARDVEPLPHPPRVPLDTLLLPSFQSDELEQLVDPVSLHLRVDAVELGEIAKVVECRRVARTGRGHPPNT